MMRFTLDHNCIVDLEEQRPAAADVRAITDAGKSCANTVCVPASTASERLPNGAYRTNIASFQEKLETLDLGHAELLFPLMRIGVGFIGLSVLSGPELEELEQMIHEILFPQIPHRLHDYYRQKNVSDDDQIAYARWLNCPASRNLAEGLVSGS